MMPASAAAIKRTCLPRMPPGLYHDSIKAIGMAGETAQMLMLRIWPFIIQFGIGFALAGLGVWAGLSSGYLSMKRPEDRRSVVIVAAGCLALLALYGAFTFWLPWLPEGAAR